MISELFLYKIIFTIEIFVAMSMYCFSLKKRNNFLIRYPLSFLVCIATSIIFPLFDGFSYTWWYTSIMFVALFLICGFAMYFIFDITWQKLFFISIIAYTIQHLSYEIYSLVAVALKLTDLSSLSIYGSTEISLSPNSLFPFLICLICYIFVYTISYILLEKKISLEDLRVNHMALLSISGFILCSEIILNSIIIYSGLSIDTLLMIVFSLYNILCCLMIIYIEFSAFRNKKMELELIATSQLLHKSEERYVESKKNIDLINLKCHDLKHQIRKYGKSGNVSKEVIDDISKMIKIYDTEVQTDNEVLDLILSEKSLLCQKQNINLKCFADCSKLGFISESDLYSLFGNSIDNAIEAVDKIMKPEKRNINIVVRNVLQFISITIDNFFEGEIVLNKDGLPKTTKGNENYHGFGLKSIQMIVNKYNGDMKVRLKKDIFSLMILFPVDGVLKE